MHISNDEYMEGDQTISRIQKLQKNIKEKDNSMKEASKQKDPKNVLNIKRELPKVRAQIGIPFQYSVHNMESSLPPR